MARGKNFGDPTPIYYKLQTALLQNIENGQWAPGECIPPERTLAEDFKVSIGTVKKALMNLVYEGYLYRIQGKGTFVAGTMLHRESLRYYRFIEDFNGREAGLKIKLLDLKTVTGQKPYNRYLKLKATQQLYEIKRSFYFNDKPVVYSISYLPCEMFHALHTFPVSFFEKGTLYEALEKNYGVPTIFNRELFQAATADARMAEWLQTRTGTPLLIIDMLAFTYKEQPYEYRRSYCLTDKRSIFREV